MGLMGLAQAFLAAQNTGIINSIRLACRISLSSFWRLLIATIMLIILSHLGLILFLMGVFLTLPLFWLGMVLAYMQLTGQPNCLDVLPPPESLFAESQS
jgi:uncharacterized membrane protein YccC